MTASANIVLAGAAVTTGLMAGLFYAWSCSVTVGLARLPDTDYLAAMQAINNAIQNPLFFSGFMGAAALLPLSAFLSYSSSSPARFGWLLAATAVYFIGVFGATAFGNVPLNDALDRFPLHSASVQEIAAQRIKFEAPWNALNTVRTAASLLALVFAIIACLTPKEN